MHGRPRRRNKTCGSTGNLSTLPWLCPIFQHLIGNLDAAFCYEILIRDITFHSG